MHDSKTVWPVRLGCVIMNTISAWNNAFLNCMEFQSVFRPFVFAIVTHTYGKVQALPDECCLAPWFTHDLQTYGKTCAWMCTHWDRNGRKPQHVGLHMHMHVRVMICYNWHDRKAQQSVDYAHNLKVLGIDGQNWTSTHAITVFTRLATQCICSGIRCSSVFLST